MPAYNLGLNAIAQISSQHPLLSWMIVSARSWYAQGTSSNIAQQVADFKFTPASVLRCASLIENEGNI